MTHLIKTSLILSLIMISLSISAQDYKTSAGARIGTYFSVSIKTFITETGAAEGIVGITRVGGQSLTTFGGFYTLNYQLTSDIPTLKWYFGAGLFTALGSEDISTNIALTGILGLEYTLKSTPINIFIDAIPYLSFNENVRFDTEASIGARYIF